MINTESSISGEPFQGEMENPDVGGGFPGRNMYEGDEDDLGDFEILGRRCADESELIVVVAAMERASGSWTMPRRVGYDTRLG